MGKRVANPFKAEKRRAGKENKNVGKGDHYSGGYRLTPDSSFNQGVCPRRDVCCSRDTCLFPSRRSRRSPVPGPPCKWLEAQQPNRGGVKTFRGGFYSPSRSYREDSVSDCSCCDSCDICEFGSHRSLSVVSTTDASFYADPLPHPLHSPYPQPRSPGGRCGKGFRYRNEGSCNHDFECPCDRDPHNSGPPGRISCGTRSQSFAEPSSYFERCSRNPIKYRCKLSEICTPPISYKNEREIENVFISPSPVRSSTRASDSGMEQSSYSTSRGSRSQTSVSPDQRRDCGKGMQIENKLNLLSKMFNQTRQHEKQIKSLEGELERLRNSGDALLSCQVSPKDVKWRPSNVLGEGSFSIVYKGSYCGTEVAVKQLKCKLLQDDKNLFHSEAALLQQLHHPRVVLLMGICTASTRPFMLLEYLSGGTLFSLIHKKTKERLDHARYFRIAKDVAQGMNYLHKHDPQVLHLDLKSMNVLLDSYTRAKIGDFGFSILRKSRGGSSALSKDFIRGTPAWMAPELLARGEVSSKCDVYSFSIILWEMLTTSHPFQGLDIYQILKTVEKGIRLPLSKSRTSRELRELITSCWAQNPSLRPSFQEILGALETLSLPVFERKIQTRTNIPPSIFSNIITESAIIGKEEKKENLNNTHHPRKLKNNRLQCGTEENILCHPFVSRKEVCNKHRGFFKNENLKELKNWPKSPRRCDIVPKVHKPADKNDIDPFPKTSFMPLGEMGNCKKELLHLSSSNLSNDINIFRDIKDPPAWNQRQGKINSHSGNRQNQEMNERRDGERKYNSNHSISRSQEEPKCSVKECAYKKGIKKSKQSKSNCSGKDGKIKSHLYGYPMELENCAVSQKPYEEQLKGPKSKKIPVYSPHRKSPERRPNCTSKCEIECQEKPNSNQLNHGGIILTAEQLLSQKKRLRPVRTSKLKHLSHLTQFLQ